MRYVEDAPVSLGTRRCCFHQVGSVVINTRRSFPESLCSIVSRLHDQAPTHSYKQTRRAILEHLKRPIEAIFDDFPTKPCASGSIAQVGHGLTASSASFTDISRAIKRVAIVVTS